MRCVSFTTLNEDSDSD